MIPKYSRVDEVSNQIRFAIDKAGFNDRLVCGAINYFEGWVVNDNKNNKIVQVVFQIDDKELTTLPIRKERLDLEMVYNQTSLGFSGVVEIPDNAFGKILTVRAIAVDGSRSLMKEYLLDYRLSQEVKDYKKLHNLPDDTLIHLVAHNIDPQAFLDQGKAGVELIRTILNRQHTDIEYFNDVLDFGVGCGRIFRWWNDYAHKVRFFGTDVNPRLIEWCRSNLDFGEFSINSPQPPTSYERSQFDLIYAFSVFTHFTVKTQEQWLLEFRRILASDGYLLLSVHGDAFAEKLPPWSYEKFRTSGHIVVNSDAEGENLCATYQSKEFSEQLFSKYFAVIERLPGALASCGNQDLFLLTKIEV